MAKNNHKNTAAYLRNHSPEIEAKRAHNTGPAAERRRAENAWHTNPLAPESPKTIRQQAVNLMRTLYKPAEAQVSNEEKRVNSISEKRKADNSYYLNWLNKQSELLNAHEDAARSQLEAAGQQAQQEVQAGWQSLHSDLASSMEATPGSVSNPADATAFDLSDEALKSGHDIQDQRTASNDQLDELGNAATVGHSINMAEIAALEGRRVSDQDEQLGKLHDARQELRLTRAAEAAKQYTAGLDKEVEKAGQRAQIAASEATAAIEAKRFGLDASKAHLDAEEFNFEKGYKGKKLGLERQELAQKETEARVHRELEEGKLTQTEAKVAIEKAKLGNETTKVENEGHRTTGERAKAIEKQKEKNQHINANILATTDTLHQSPKLRKLAHENPAKLREILHNKYGYNAIAIQVATEMYLTGSLSKSTEAQLAALGYNGKYLNG